MDVRTRFHEVDDKLIVERVQDCQPILENAKKLHLAGQRGKSELRHAARFPAVVVERYCNTAGITFQEFLRNPVHVDRMLADRDLMHFRVA